MITNELKIEISDYITTYMANYIADDIADHVEYCMVDSKIYEFICMIKNKFGFEDISCCHSDDGDFLCFDVTYNDIDWKRLVVLGDGESEIIEERFKNALFNNEWDYTYSVHLNAVIIKDIIKHFNHRESPYCVSQNMLYYETNKEAGNQVNHEKVVDLSAVKSIEFLTKDGFELSTLILSNDDEILEIRQQDFSRKMKQ
jgi:hypothetical protein